MGGNHSRQAQEAAVTVRFSVTVRQVLEDGTEVPVEEELAAALAGTAEQFAGLAADEARFCDLGEREEVIGTEGTRAAAAAAGGHARGRRRTRGAGCPGHERRGDRSRQRRGRP
jgi:hypothetical protein